MAGRNAFHVPVVFNLDFSIYKSVRLTERISLQLRLEVQRSEPFQLAHERRFRLHHRGTRFITDSYSVPPNGLINGAVLR